MRKRLVVFLLALLIISVGGILIYRNSSRGVFVDAIVVEKKSIINYVTPSTIPYLKAKRQVGLSSPVGGKIARIYVRS